MALKRILFPAIAVLVPVGILGMIYFESRDRLTRAFEKEADAARKAGFAVSVEEMRKLMPAPADNASVHLQKAYQAANWTAIGKIAAPYAGTYLAATDSMAKPLADAASSSALELELQPAEAILECERQVKAAGILARRATAKSYTGDLQGAIADLEAVCRIRDLMAKSRFGFMAISADTLNPYIQIASLEIALRHGALAVPAAKKAFIGDPMTFKLTEITKFDPAHRLRELELGFDQSPRNRQSDLLQAKTDTLRACVDLFDDASPRQSTQIYGTLTSASYTHYSRGMRVTMSAPMSPPPTRMRAPKEIMAAFWAGCEAGGKPPGLEKMLDAYGTPIRFTAYPNGVMFWGFGKNRLNESGAGDDQYVIVRKGLVNFR